MCDGADGDDRTFSFGVRGPEEGAVGEWRGGSAHLGAAALCGEQSGGYEQI